MGQALWFASRGTGLVALLLLTGTVVLGAEHAARSATGNWPRFTVHAVHRNLSVLAVAFTAIHVATAIIDPYAGITWIDVVVPFTSVYKPFYLGLGAIALDLMLALIITSVLRARIPLRVWQYVHYAAYGLWPIAVVHGLGAGGADSGLLWVQVLNVACVLAVGVATWRRLARRNRPHVTVPTQRRAGGRRRAGRAPEKAGQR